MHPEADFGPHQGSADFLARLPHPMTGAKLRYGKQFRLQVTSPGKSSRPHGERIGSIHIKDRLRNPDGSVTTKPLGQGSADFGDVFECIRGIGYSGGFTLQVARGESGDEVNSIRQQVAFVRSRWN